MKNLFVLLLMSTLVVSTANAKNNQKRKVASDYCANVPYNAVYGIIKSFDASVKQSDLTTEIIEQGFKYKVGTAKDKYEVVVDPIVPNEGTCTLISVKRLDYTPAAPSTPESNSYQRPSPNPAP